MTDRYEEYAPGFKDLVLERHINTPMDQENSNPSAVRGNMIGGSAIPEQAGENRPLPGVVENGVARSFFPGLYLSNSIHPFGATHLATGYIAAVRGRRGPRLPRRRVVAGQSRSSGSWRTWRSHPAQPGCGREVEGRLQAGEAQA